VSTLTKVLIVLLTVSSIFLCGIVATYVANAEDYKDKWTRLRTQADADRRNSDKANQDLNAAKTEFDRVEQQLNTQIGDLQIQISELDAKLNQSEREKSALLAKVDGWTSIAKDFQQSIDTQQQALNNTQDELHKVESERDKLKSQNKEVTAALLEKMAIISQLEEQGKQLVSEKSQLQTKLAQLLRQFGKKVATTTAAPPKSSDKVQLVAPKPPAPVVTTEVRDLGLKGLITRVDLKNSLAEVSIGAADGVKEGMKFYATRGDAFICEVLVLSVDAERAVGYIERVQTPPKSGDNVSTNIGS